MLIIIPPLLTVPTWAAGSDTPTPPASPTPMPRTRRIRRRRRAAARVAGRRGRRGTAVIPRGRWKPHQGVEAQGRGWADGWDGVNFEW